MSQEKGLITLFGTQEVGMRLLREKIDEANKLQAESRTNLQNFLLQCLEENGGDKEKPWNWDDETMEWTLQNK
jgi:hypothetical protein|tara:strand:- start:280 stop:498 length:219 start_codon:yes stop_codon:yes gene_type:complete